MVGDDLFFVKIGIENEIINIFNIDKGPGVISMFL